MADARGSDCGDEDSGGSGNGDLDEELERRLERLRPPRKSPEELNELEPVTEDIRPAIEQEDDVAGVADGGDEGSAASDDQQRCTLRSDGDVNPAVAAVNELAPVTDDLRPVSEQIGASNDSATKSGESQRVGSDTGDGEEKEGCD